MNKNATLRIGTCHTLLHGDVACINAIVKMLTNGDIHIVRPYPEDWDMTLPQVIKIPSSNIELYFDKTMYNESTEEKDDSE